MVRGGSLLILRFVGQRSRSQLLKIECKFDTISELATKLEHIQIKETDLKIKALESKQADSSTKQNK